LEAYILLEMIIIQINSSVNISSEIDQKLSYIRSILDCISFPKGEAYYNYAMSLKFRAQLNHSKAIYYAENAIEICKNNNIQEDIYAWDMVTLATIYMKISKINEAKRLCMDAIDVFSKNKNNNGIITGRCMIAKINKEQGYPIKKVLDEYYEIEKLSIKLKLYKRIIFILINIAELYIDEEQYEEAKKSLLKALEIEKDEGIDFYSMNICTNLCIVYLKLGRYKLAVKYYCLINQMRKVVLLIEDDVFSITKVNVLYNMFICNDLEAYNYLHQSYKINSESNTYYSKFIMCIYYKLKLNACHNKEEIEIIYRLLLIKLSKLNNAKTKMHIKISAIKTILDLGYYESARKFFYEIGERPKSSIIEAIYTYIKFEFIDKELYNLWIKKALKLCEIINDKKLCAELYGVIGGKYEELGDFVYALNNFYESIALHIDIINCLPEDDKLIYMNNSGFLEVRQKIILCLRRKLGSKLKYAHIEKVGSIKDLNSIIEEINIKNILSDKKIYNLVQKTYEKDYCNDLSDIYKVFDMFSSDIIGNIENIVKYMARLTLSDKAVLVMEDSDGENKVLCSYRISDKEEIDRYFSFKLDSDEDVIIVDNNDNKSDQVQNEILKNGIRSCIYMKLKNKERRINSEMNVNGQVILISTKGINYINSESKKIIERFKSFLIFLLEKYKLTISSTLDKLTSTYNRKYLEESLLFLLDSSQAEHSRFALIMFDIDDFKGVNDKYGHQIGDKVLIKLTKEVKKTINKNDIIGRYGGEEFIVLIQNVDKIKAVNMAERIRRNVEEAKILGEKRKVTISLGVAISSDKRMSSEEIVSRADQALYRAKHEGKNRYILWNDDYLEENNNFNSLNELSGVITKNNAKDYNFISVIKEITSIVKNKEDKEVKMYNFILKIMQVIECDNVTLFIIKNGKVVNILSKYRFTDGWSKNERFNLELVNKTIISKKGCYKIDWNNIYKQGDYGIPDWKSICITPIICDGQILALIYVSVSVNKKEFTAVDLNQLNFLAEIGIPIFE
ncbi:MAG: tetratricopeptide repeat-containing diguanylate cyclase, partial [Clostridium sp.]